MNKFFTSKYEAPQIGLLLIAIGVLGRLIPHAPNFVPIGALAIWGGFRLQPPKNYLYVLGAMVLTDFFLGFHSTLLYVYGSYAVIIWLAGRLKTTPLAILGTTVLGSVLFFLVTNFGVWAEGAMYPHTMAGLLQSYAMGIPFFRMTFLGDLVYTTLFFGAEYGVLTALQKHAIVRKPH